MPNELAESNRKWWNEQAATYNSAPWQQKMASQISEFVVSNIHMLDLDAQSSRPKHRRLLDYACGTGMVTKALAPFIDEARGIDIASSMVQRYNEMFSNASPSSNGDFSAEAVEGDLLRDEVTKEAKLLTPQLYDFDIAVVGLGFHHFESAETTISRLAERVKHKTGVVAIVDFVDDGGSFPSQAAHTVSKHGFSESDMSSLFNDAGMQDFKWKVMEKQVEMVGKDGASKHRSIFLASARRV